MSQNFNARRSTNAYKYASVTVPIDDIELDGDLCIPRGARGIVVFAHGSGSSRFSPRSHFVADMLREHTVGSLLIDLLTPQEESIDERTHELRLDVDLLAKRLEKIGEWVLDQPEMHTLKLGYFGASTGSAAALIAAAAQPDLVQAVVSRGGRPDLAISVLSKVKAPTLLIVGGKDLQVVAWNKQAIKILNDDSRLEIIPHATHLFDEAGALEAVAQMAAEWFRRHFIITPK